MCDCTVDVFSVKRDLLCRNESFPMSLVEDGGLVSERCKSSKYPASERRSNRDYILEALRSYPHPFVAALASREI